MNIEELAFKDRKILANLNAVDLLNIIEFLQDDRRQCLEELSKLKEEITNLSKDVDMWNAKYNDMFDENRELKEILANNGIVSTCENCETFGVCPHSYREYDYKCELDKVTIQQKEFIKWLEDYINLFDKKDIYEEGSCDMLEEILQKYRSIIGVSDENNMEKSK